ncbi:MAG: DMT family transporter [Ornithinimicrobium sp.]|uniref:DMT family transporter n=1 Tax=Ornithinimicrobium sp. TaxID=1977084 RepID=UPI003D9AD1F3
MHTESARTQVLALAAAFATGALLALQSRLNGRLAETVGGFPAAWVSFGSGLLILSVLLVRAEHRSRLGRVWVAVRSGRLRWWQVLGGVSGGLLVGTQTYAVPLVGVAAFLIATIGGQALSALLVDRQGLGPAPAVPLSGVRIAAAITAVAGVAIAATAGGGSGGRATLGLVPVLLAFGVGMLLAVQQAFNGRVNTVTGAPTATAWLNFATGSATLVLVGTVPVALSGGPERWDAPAWAWWGGLCGVVFIALTAWAVQHLGVLLFGLVTITSQMATALVLDLGNPATRDQVGAQMLTGVAITVLAAGAAAAAAQSDRRSARRSAVPASPA